MADSLVFALGSNRCPVTLGTRITLRANEVTLDLGAASFNGIWQISAADRTRTNYINVGLKWAPAPTATSRRSGIWRGAAWFNNFRVFWTRGTNVRPTWDQIQTAVAWSQSARATNPPDVMASVSIDIETPSSPFVPIDQITSERIAETMDRMLNSTNSIEAIVRTLRRTTNGNQASMDRIDQFIERVSDPARRSELVQELRRQEDAEFVASTTPRPTAREVFGDSALTEAIEQERSKTGLLILGRIPSRSNPSKAPYEVYLNPGNNEVTCNCPGWINNKKCRHVVAFSAMVGPLNFSTVQAIVSSIPEPKPRPTPIAAAPLNPKRKISFD